MGSIGNIANTLVSAATKYLDATVAMAQESPIRLVGAEGKVAEALAGILIAFPFNAMEHALDAYP